MARQRACVATVRFGAFALTIALGAGLSSVPALANDDVPGTTTPLVPTTIIEPPPSEPSPTSTTDPTTTATASTHTTSPTPVSEPALAPATADTQPSDASTANEDGSLGDFGGVIFTDLNVNGVADPGETGLAGVVIDIHSSQAGVRYQQTTDAQGRFSFPDIPTGTYYLNYTAPHPWIVRGIIGNPFDSVVISDSPQYSDVWIPAVRSLSESLRVSMFFDRDVYQADETVQLTVVLANSGDRAITGVTAACFPGEDMPNLRGGPGWGPLAEGGPGVTVPASEARLVTVSEPVPAAAPRFGYVTAMCDFGAPGYPVHAAVNAHATAKVPGLPGAGHAWMFHDIDGDYHFDEDEAVAGVTVLITDPDTGAVVARLTTDTSGAFAVDNLPATVYDVRIDGPWKPRSEIFGFRLPVVAGTSWSGDPWLSVVPGSAEENRRPNLQVSAAFDKPVYNSDETIRVRLTVTNIGEAAAEGVRANAGGGELGLFVPSMGELSWFGPGIRIEPGVTRVFEIEGTVPKPQGGVIFSVYVEASGWDINFDNNRYAIVATLIATRGTYAGVLYGDRNNNGVMDPGEAFSRTPIDLTGGTPRSEFHQSTDAQGRFAFRDIPTGRYSARYHIPGGWLIPNTEIVVREGEQPEVQVRAARPQKEFLQANIAFTKDTYAVGEIAHLTITLTNRGPSDLTGITALCSGPGDPHEIYSFGPGWGAIAENGPGVAVRAGETATFDVWTVIPEGGFVYGYVRASCYFGAPIDPQTSPSAYDEAKVPGGVGSAGGLLLYDRNSDSDDEGDGVADTKIVLLDKHNGKVVARTVTDTRGHFMFRNVPADHYDVLVVGPWKITECWCPGVLAGQELDIYHVGVVPGAIQPDPDSPQNEPDNPQDESDNPRGEPVNPQDEPNPIPQGTAAPAGRLASTGAGVLGLLVGALTMLSVGLVIVLVRKRRLLSRASREA